MIGRQGLIKCRARRLQPRHAVAAMANGHAVTRKRRRAAIHHPTCPRPWVIQKLQQPCLMIAHQAYLIKADRRSVENKIDNAL
jgi:hypothetical protein